MRKLKFGFREGAQELSLLWSTQVMHETAARLRWRGLRVEVCRRSLLHKSPSAAKSPLRLRLSQNVPEFQFHFSFSNLFCASLCNFSFDVLIGFWGTCAEVPCLLPVLLNFFSSPPLRKPSNSQRRAGEGKEGKVYQTEYDTSKIQDKK